MGAYILLVPSVFLIKGGAGVLCYYIRYYRLLRKYPGLYRRPLFGQQTN